ncbi:hypothetical protein NDU88_005626 [Pleurodeles waltl]|uniref:Uncharacterized protein n=1 Tax=Pleurodeles waltl TaxID=8319 RepID=A0AAV7NN06_PLEWA|nr:hypothetical protein NDU88_005626 [Pleurodeles waltl]
MMGPEVGDAMPTSAGSRLWSYSQGWTCTSAPSALGEEVSSELHRELKVRHPILKGEAWASAVRQATAARQTHPSQLHACNEPTKSVPLHPPVHSPGARSQRMSRTLKATVTTGPTPQPPGPSTSVGQSKLHRAVHSSAIVSRGVLRWCTENGRHHRLLAFAS